MKQRIIPLLLALMLLLPALTGALPAVAAEEGFRVGRTLKVTLGGTGGEEIIYHASGLDGYIAPWRLNGHTVSVLEGAGTLWYCIQPGVAYANGMNYEVADRLQNEYWRGQAAAKYYDGSVYKMTVSAQTGVVLATMFGLSAGNSPVMLGYPADTPEYRDAAYIATQTIIWEYVMGLRTDADPNRTTKLSAAEKDGEGRGQNVIGTAAETAYKNILAKMQAYIASGKNVLESTDYVGSFRVIAGSTGAGQMMATMLRDDIPGEFGKIIVYKVDQKGNKLNGAKFRIFDENGNRVFPNDLETNVNGIAETPEELPFGVYTIIETVAPEGCELDNTPRTVWVYEGNDGVAEYTAVNQKTGSTFVRISIGKDYVGYNAGSSVEYPDIELIDESNGAVAARNRAGYPESIGAGGFYEGDPGHDCYALFRLFYGEQDVGVHYYTAREVPGTLPNVRYDSGTVRIKVTVTKGGVDMAELIAKAEIVSAKRHFENVWSDSWTPAAIKLLNGEAPGDERFTFVLERGGSVISTVSNDSDGYITFPAISFGKADIGKTYTFKAYEKAGGDAGVKYDSRVITWTVGIRYLSETDVTPTVTVVCDATDTLFDNFRPSGSFTPEATKQLAGGTLAEGQFEFVLKEGDNVLQTVSNKADGSIPFAAINYTLADVGEHVYTISETKGSDAAVSYDSHTLTYKVNVSYSGSGTALTVTSTSEGSKSFENAKPTGRFTPEATKQLAGGTLAEGQFEFVLKEGDNVLQTVSNKADGSVPFTAINYTLADVGEHVYTISEVAGGEYGTIYDGHTLVITVTVGYDGTGEDLTVTVETTGDKEYINLKPSIGTSAEVEGEKEVFPGKTTLTDTVSFKSLAPGKEYTLKGILMNKKTGEPFLVDNKEVTAETKFTPEAESGEATVTFEFDTSEITETMSIVVFETIYLDGIELAVHADIEDEGQTITVYVPEIRTTAKIDGEKQKLLKGVAETVTITDTVSYRNLIPGKEYTVKGILMDGKTGEPFLVDNKEVTAETTFTAKLPAGEAVLEYVFSTAGLGSDAKLVVFETVYSDGKEIAAHADIEDAGQTVIIRDIPKTGDSSVNVIVLAIVALAAAAGVAVVIKKRF